MIKFSLEISKSWSPLTKETVTDLQFSLLDVKWKSLVHSQKESESNTLDLDSKREAGK